MTDGGLSMADLAAKRAAENFPVGSFLIAPAVRRHVRAFYAFARTADDIADNPDLSADDRIAALDAMDAALVGGPGPEVARTLGTTLAERDVPVAHARDLLVAFRQDAAGLVCHDWADLVGYCRHSANPVGRVLLALHGEPPETRAPSDALCTALQILNHLQDCKEDYQRLGRIYIPVTWIDQAGGDRSDLGRARMTPGLATAIARVLEATTPLIDEADILAETINSPRLAGEARTIAHLARRLHRALRAGDPLAARIAPSARDKLAATGAGLGLTATRCLTPRKAAWGMR